MYILCVFVLHQDISTFMAVLIQQAHNAASLPMRLRQLYRLRKQRELSRQERKCVKCCAGSWYLYLTNGNMMRCYRTGAARSAQLDMFYVFRHVARTRSTDVLGPNGDYNILHHERVSIMRMTFLQLHLPLFQRA